MQLTPPQGITTGAAGATSAFAAPTRTASPFDDLVEITSQAANNVQQAMTNADQFATRMAVGEDVDIHSAIVAMEKASLAVEMTLQVRNRALEAYREIISMQV